MPVTRSAGRSSRWRGVSANPKRWKRGALRVSLILCVLAAVPGMLGNAPPADLTEYQLKAVFLYNFAKFIEWPSSSFSSNQAPFSVCILGHDPFAGALDSTLAGKAIAQRPLVVERIKEKADAWHCQILFVSSSETHTYPDIFAVLRGSSALLVGETDGFASSGGMVEFVVEEEHVRFAINPDTARRAGLNVSSKLLALARIVHGESHLKGS